MSNKRPYPFKPRAGPPSKQKKARIDAAAPRARPLPPLSADQQAIVAFARAHPAASLFVTGPGGCGKSVALEAVAAALRGAGTVAITASTGLAAVEVGGVTLHSFLGLGMHADTTDAAQRDALIAAMSAKKKQALREARNLIVEEVSMVSGAFFTNLDMVLRSVRLGPDAAHLPMGGLRLLIFGDFFQLPPVMPAPVVFAFESPAWPALAPRAFELGEDFRHAGAANTFAQMMAEVRRGLVTPATAAALAARVLPPPPADSGALVTYIFPHNADVDAMNAERLAALPGAARRFAADDVVMQGARPGGGGGDPFAKTRAFPVVELKVGAQVMLTRNLLLDPEGDTGVTLANGMVGRVFAFGDDGWPLVSFAPWHAQAVPIKPEKWEIRASAGGPLLAVRYQLPLQLAYAMSGYKSQGQTITCAVVADLGKSFGPGQVYVILSRVRRLEQLYLRSFDATKIYAHPKVVAFYAALHAPTAPAGTQ